VETGQGPEMTGIAVRVDGDQLAVAGCIAQYSLPFADGGQTGGVRAVREDGQPDVVVSGGV
jgi:hypothetical protein